MSILSVENVSKTYGDQTLFDDISFTITNGQRIGLIGVNGTGKSTLMKIIANLETADTGSKQHAKDFSLEYLPQEPVLDADLTVLEQIYYGQSKVMATIRAYEQVLQQLSLDPENTKLQEKMLNLQQQMDEHDAWEANTTAKMILTKLGIEAFDKKVGELSGGQKKRVAIAKALIQPADLLLLDEPTNHLDNETIEWLEGYLAQFKGALMVVTHDRYFLNRVTNLIYELDRGSLYTYEGNYETFLEKKAEREEWERQAEEKHQNALRRELAWLKRGAKARTTKQKARKQRVEAMQEQSFATDKQDVDMAIGSTRLGKQVLELKNISHTFAGQSLIDQFSYLVVPEERIGIIGPNGSGKTTLLNIMAERLNPDSGEVDIGSTVKIGYYTQDHEEIDGSLKVIEYIKEVAEVISTAEGTEITAEQMLERFLFPRSKQWTYIRRLSGGERRRLYLLRVLMKEPNVLFLDEPTNDLDTETLSVLEDYLDQFPGVVITVSHDRYFLDRVVDKLIVFNGTGAVKRYYGNYSEYLQQYQQNKEDQAVKKVETSEQEKTRRSNRKRKLSYREKQEWETIEDDIAELESEIEEIDGEMAAAAADYSKVEELSAKKQELETKLEQKMERWEELSLLVESIDNQ
ncbi:putative ABC transporter ATP-binding protein YfmR [Halobacillus andaensis]|uniref:ABC transporter ATP-binding protein YfmR n=1 Tax=Halobacillus andaensis TaxID=1176239 RepID=A0A917B6F4_HALAA|nr:ABC-F family ATP-binding cassette domain-containing protein [Halobacillus andaensis]MBP2004513.1 ATP-binding cassette subfamily F protein uup [Halobacillus andaensis]GGF21082.1 putative ABC transporter ATP-binding protein YfmR [Halobacillus andaensis]